MMTDIDKAAAELLVNQNGPSPGNAPGTLPNDPSSAGQNVSPPVKPSADAPEKDDPPR